MVSKYLSVLVLMGFLLGAMTGCGTSSRAGRGSGGNGNGGSSSSGNGGSVGGGSGNGTGVNTPSPGPFLFIANQEGSVLEVSLNTGTGAAGNPNGTATAVGAPARAVTGTPNGKYVYLATDTGIEAFTIGSNGTLTPIAGSPFSLSGSKPTDIGVDSQGNNVYVVFNGSNQVASYHIQSDGSLGQANTASTGANPLSLTTDNSGKFLYVANNGSSNVSAFSVAASGTLSSITGSPFNAAPQASPTTGPGPIAVAGKFLFVASDGFLMGYTIDSNSGTLTPLSGMQFPDSTVIIAPHAMIADPNGTFLVTSNLTPDTSPSFTQVITINTANGQLTNGGTAQGANSTATVSPLAIDQKGQHVYGIGLLDTSCITSCTKAVESFAVTSATITTIGTPVSTGLQGSDAIAISPF